MTVLPFVAKSPSHTALPVGVMVGEVVTSRFLPIGGMQNARDALTNTWLASLRSITVLISASEKKS